MDDQRIGRTIRALRRRLGWRQSDLARRARCSQKSISRAEAGHPPSLPTLRRILAALDASVFVEIRWRAGALDRLLDQDHATLTTTVVALLQKVGWEVRVEVTYSEFGERGSIDILAFMPSTRVLLVIEIKTDIAAVEATLRKIDEKVRLAPRFAPERFGWDVRAVSWLLVMPESNTLRRRVAAQDALFARVFPARGRDVRTWLRRPENAIAGLLFLSPRHRTTTTQHRGGRERVRAANSPPPSRELTT